MAQTLAVHKPARSVTVTTMSLTGLNMDDAGNYADYMILLARTDPMRKPNIGPELFPCADSAGCKNRAHSQANRRIRLYPNIFTDARIPASSLMGQKARMDHRHETLNGAARAPVRPAGVDADQSGRYYDLAKSARVNGRPAIDSTASRGLGEALAEARAGAQQPAGQNSAADAGLSDVVGTW